ncbi:MAG: U32 family peptidase, partial [Lachnospiraceae bacterium]|nr:U32 family peptidase [Lachnospiraceae bacterium]
MQREKEGLPSVVQRDKKVELLAPAGSFESLKGAVHAGADAVYMGGALFSARAYADNPDDEGLIKAVRYCHFYGRKLYLAVNTLLKQKEIDTDLYDFMSKAYEAGIDGVIVQDLGVMRFIGSKFPDLPIHLSTQASVMTAEGAEFLRSQIPSVTRVVPARELSLEELRRFRDRTDLEIEVFVHGALCICYSGMCLMSSYIGDRSGNRGRCAQPCRKEYEAGFAGLGGAGTISDGLANGINRTISGGGKYLLSPKDQCLIEDIPALIDIGVDSFKIEGRMKSPEYTAGTVAVYRQKIDEACGNGGEIFFCGVSDVVTADRADTRDLDILAELYNRGGFNRGYLFCHNGRDMMSLLRPNHSGTRIGRVEKTNGREAQILTEGRVYDHDVLEIRHGEKKIFEFTTAQDCPAGGVLKTLTMKDSRAAKGDTVYRTRCNRLLENIRNTYIDGTLKIPVNITFTAHADRETLLTFGYISDDPELTVKVVGNPATKAMKAPMTGESIRKHLGKLTDTGFEVASVEPDIDGGLFIPVSQLNDMRREACRRLESAIYERVRPVRLDRSNEKGSDSTGSLCVDTVTGRINELYNTC